MNQKLKVGIVGCGGIANQNHLPVWEKIKNVDIIICDKNEKLARNTANKFGFSNYYTDFSEMLEREKPGVIDNCTPVQLHTALSVKAMEAGCHVIVEKPMALNKKDANKMIKIAKENRVLLYPIHNTLFNPIMLEAKSLITRREIGDILGMDVSYLKRRDDEWVINKDHWSHKLPGGIFGEILAHPIYLELAILRKLHVSSVHTRKFLNYKWIKSDELRVTLDGEDGFGRIMLSLNSPKISALVNVYGTKENLEIDLWGLCLIKHKSLKYSKFSFGKDNINLAFQRFKNTISAVTKTIRGKALPGHYTLIPNFVNVIRNKDKPLVTMEDGLKVAEILEKITTQIDRVCKPHDN
jgi:predicted dehydrogenase